MSHTFRRLAVVAGACLLLVGCVTAPTMDATGCSNVQGVIGREFHVSAHAKADAPGSGAEGGFNLFVGPAPMSQQLRDVLIIADELCHAEARMPPLIHQGAYDEYMSKALGGLGAEAVKAGVLTSVAMKAAQEKGSNAVASVRGDGVGKLAPGQIANQAAAIASSPEGVLSQAIADGDNLKKIARQNQFYSINIGSGERDIKLLEVRLSTIENDLATLKRGQRTTSFDILGFVTFDFRSAALDGQARNEIRSMIEGTPQVALHLEAYTDTVGSYRANAQLSAIRGKAVADYIHALEPNRTVTQAALGRTDAFGETGAENRRVTITTTPSPLR